MPRQVVLKFPVELPKESLKDTEALNNGKKTIVLELLRKGELSRSQAAELLEIDKPALVNLIAEYAIPMLDITGKGIKAKSRKVSLYSVKANNFLKNAGMVSLGGDAVKEAGRYDE